MKIKKLYSCSLIVLLLVTMFVSCNNQDFDPFEEETRAFSIYGLLRAGESPTYIRVKDLREPFLTTQGERDYTVLFEDLETGKVSTLQDSIYDFSGSYTRNFIINEQIEEDRLYRVTVTSVDGVISQSEAKTPMNTEVVLSPSLYSYVCDNFIEMTFKNVVDPESIDLEFTLIDGNVVHKAALNFFKDQFKRSAETNELELLMRPRDLLLELFGEYKGSNAFNPYDKFPDVYCKDKSWDMYIIASGTVTVRYTHLSREWANAARFGGLIDIESGDVENGLGFFGGIHEGSFTITWGE